MRRQRKLGTFDRVIRRGSRRSQGDSSRAKTKADHYAVLHCLGAADAADFAFDGQALEAGERQGEEEADSAIERDECF